MADYYKPRPQAFAETPFNAIRFKLNEIATKFDYIMNVDINAMDCSQALPDHRLITWETASGNKCCYWENFCA